MTRYESPWSVAASRGACTSSACAASPTPTWWPCDRDSHRLGAAASDFGIRHAFGHHRDLLGQKAVDLLTICTMPDTHREIAVDALDAGAAVLCEKPMAADLDAALAMADAAERPDRPLAIGFNLRFSTAARLPARSSWTGGSGHRCARGARCSRPRFRGGGLITFERPPGEMRSTRPQST